jgi:hypothetical protein
MAWGTRQRAASTYLEKHRFILKYWFQLSRNLSNNVIIISQLIFIRHTSASFWFIFHYVLPHMILWLPIFSLQLTYEHLHFAKLYHVSERLACRMVPNINYYTIIIIILKSLSELTNF